MKTPKKVIEKITLPLMFVMFVMAVLVFAVSPVSAAPDQCALVFCDQDDDGFFRDHKKCPNACGGSIDCDDNNELVPIPEACDSGDGGGAELYDVTITEPGLVTGGGVRWKYNGRSIDYPTFNQPVGITASLDLTFFEEDSGPFGPQGLRCFGGSGDTLHTAGLLKHRGSDAHGKFWFFGYTDHVSTGERIQVLYLLIVDGWFQDGPKGWPENGFEGGNEMHMVNWELKVENEGNTIANRSCEGSGNDPEFMTVFVEPSP